MRNDDTLIPRFFGLIRIKTAAGRNIRMVVMQNLMPDEVRRATGVLAIAPRQCLAAALVPHDL